MQPVAAWHPHVEQQHVGLGYLEQRQQIVAVGCLANDLDVAVGQDRSDTPPDHLVVVGNNYLDLHIPAATVPMPCDTPPRQKGRAR
jgi:hypothetical protein